MPSIVMNLPETPNAVPAPLVTNYSGEAGVPFSRVLRHWWDMTGPRPGRPWQYLLGTFAYNCLLGALLTVLFMGTSQNVTWFTMFWQTLWVSNCIGFTIHGLFELFFRLTMVHFMSWPGPVKSLAAMSIALTGVLVGYSVAFGALGRNFFAIMAQHPRSALSLMAVGVLGCLIWLLIMDGQTRRLRAETDGAKSREAEALLKRQASEAELRALQAQIEPHFLFNTLANVQALIDYEPAKSKQMLEAFIDYLRGTLDASRRAHTSLGDELRLLRRYLDVMGVRMGERLKVELDVPSDLHSLAFAPLLLQPLVENAIKYGLEPKIDGGTIRIGAAFVDEQRRRLKLWVQDDGVGLDRATSSAKRMSPGSGTGVPNVRARLQTLFGASASLNLMRQGELTAAEIEFDLPEASS
jgi:two-component sensor histidine kinase